VGTTRNAAKIALQGKYMAKSRVLIEEQQREQIAWYETGLPLLERKRRGHFSTPPLLVEQILEACGYTPDNELTRIRVLDPACGSGNFLAGAAQRLLAFGTRIGFSPEERTSLIRRNLWGFDPDPISCFLAEMQLHTIINSNASDPHGSNSSFVSGMSGPGGRSASRLPWGSHPITPLHIHQADSLVLPWEPGVDLFVANPPYLAAKNNDLSCYRFAQQRGQADSYLLFLSLALQVVRPGGWIGLVLPDPLIARANAAKERKRMLEEATLHHLWHLSDVFAADVGAVVIIAQKCPPQRMHHVSWVRGRWQSNSSFASQQQVQQSLFRRQPGAEFRYLLSQGRGAALEQMRICLEETPESERRFAPLGAFLSISRGEELGRESPFIQNITSPHQQSALCFDSYTFSVYGRGDPGGRIAYAHPDSNPDTHHPAAGLPTLPAYYPLLRGGIDIHPYRSPTPNCQIAREAITKPLERYLSPKLLVVKSTDRLQAALDLHGHIALQTLYLLHPRHQHESLDQLYFFLALLNSRLLREYVYVLHTAYKWVQPQIEQRVLASLPVPIVEHEHQQQVIKQAKSLENACSSLGPVVEWDEHITGMYEEQERTICALYGVSM
jgi:Eco57I restriction-modification methylase/restriction endonuclease TaqI-like protein